MGSNDIFGWRSPALALGNSASIKQLHLSDPSIFFKSNLPTTNKGFTSHETLDEMGIVHMNGRIYDARIARFLQADPFVQTEAGARAVIQQPQQGVGRVRRNPHQASAAPVAW